MIGLQYYSYAFNPGAFGEKPSGSGGDSLTSRQTRQHADPNKVDFIFYSLSMSQMNSAITRLEKMIVSDFLNIILKDSVIKQLTGDQVILELRHEKTSPVFLVSDQVRHKQGYTATEDS